MLTVKHDRPGIENNPRVIREDELSRYLGDGWRVIESQPQPVEIPVVAAVPEPVSTVEQVQRESEQDNLEPKEVSAVTADPKPEIYRGRGRPPKR